MCIFKMAKVYHVVFTVVFFENVASEIRLVLFYVTLVLMKNDNYRIRVSWLP